MNVDTDKEFDLSMYYNRHSIAFAQLHQVMVDLRNLPADPTRPWVTLPAEYGDLIQRVLKYVCEEGCNRAVDTMQGILFTVPRPDLHGVVYSILPDRRTTISNAEPMPGWTE